MAGNIEVSFDVNKLAGDIVRKFQVISTPELKKAEKDISQRLLRAAKEEVHRYQERTGRLKGATETKGSLTDQNGMLFRVDIKKARYGIFIIRGHGTWKPDPFLDKALEQNKTYIRQRIASAFNGAIVQFNKLL